MTDISPLLALCNWRFKISESEGLDAFDLQLSVFSWNKFGIVSSTDKEYSFKEGSSAEQVGDVKYDVISLDEFEALNPHLVVASEIDLIGAGFENTISITIKAEVTAKPGTETEDSGLTVIIVVVAVAVVVILIVIVALHLYFKDKKRSRRCRRQIKRCRKRYCCKCKGKKILTGWKIEKMKEQDELE